VSEEKQHWQVLRGNQYGEKPVYLNETFKSRACEHEIQASLPEDR
jgi:hypothetical protein